MHKDLFFIHKNLLSFILNLKIYFETVLTNTTKNVFF
jgi:hypothetical protein